MTSSTPIPALEINQPLPCIEILSALRSLAVHHNLLDSARQDAWEPGAQPLFTYRYLLYR